MYKDCFSDNANPNIFDNNSQFIRSNLGEIPIVIQTEDNNFITAKDNINPTIDNINSITDTIIPIDNHSKL